jgi:hypothetical protein
MSGVFSMASHWVLQYLPDVVMQEQMGCAHFSAFSAVIFSPNVGSRTDDPRGMLVLTKGHFCPERNTFGRPLELKASLRGGAAGRDSCPAKPAAVRVRGRLYATLRDTNTGLAGCPFVPWLDTINATERRRVCSDTSDLAWWAPWWLLWLSACFPTWFATLKSAGCSMVAPGLLARPKNEGNRDRPPPALGFLHRSRA